MMTGTVTVVRNDWYIITTRRTHRWRGKRMVVTDWRWCRIAELRPGTHAYFSVLGDGSMPWD